MMFAEGRGMRVSLTTVVTTWISPCIQTTGSFPATRSRHATRQHVYAVTVGRDRKAWRKALVELPYPKPRLELTMAARAMRWAA